MAWLTGWTYRKSHVINAQAGAGTNYQKKIIVHYGAGEDSGEDVYLNGKCKTDFGDIRFTDDDGSTELNYWMQSKTDSDNAVFWVEVADSLESSSVTIYLYYSNNSASTTSNFDNTFIFGDPFVSETLDTDRWPSINGNPVYSINAVNHYLEVTDMDGTNWLNGKGFHSRALTFPSSWIVEDAYGNSNGVYAYEATSAANEINWGSFVVHHTDWGSSDEGIVFFAVTDVQGNSQRVAIYAGVGGNQWDYDNNRIDAATYTTYFTFTKTNGTIVVKESGVIRVSEANAETPNIFHLGIGRLTTYPFGTQRFGAFLIRKYVSPEPAHGAWGSEETEGGVIISSSSIIPQILGEML